MEYIGARTIPFMVVSSHISKSHPCCLFGLDWARVGEGKATKRVKTAGSGLGALPASQDYREPRGRASKSSWGGVKGFA